MRLISLMIILMGCFFAHSQTTLILGSDTLNLKTYEYNGSTYLSTVKFNKVIDLTQTLFKKSENQLSVIRNRDSLTVELNLKVEEYKNIAETNDTIITVMLEKEANYKDELNKLKSINSIYSKKAKRGRRNWALVSLASLVVGVLIAK